jgi:Uma2 family endonuclease
MLKVRIPAQQRFILDGVSWPHYTRLLHGFSDRHVRLTFDGGVLEIMTLSHEHEGLVTFLDQLIITLTQELNLPLKMGGSTTFRKRRAQKGLEPDRCYWIAHEAEVRGKTRIDLRIDPPPDLGLEVDVSHSSLDRMGIYASLRVPEIWRYDSAGLAFFTLNPDLSYAPVPISGWLPIPLRPGDLMPFIQMRGSIDENAIFRQFRAWIRKRLAAQAT